MTEVSRMKGQRKQPKGKQPPQRSLMSMWQRKNGGKSETSSDVEGGPSAEDNGHRTNASSGSGTDKRTDESKGHSSIDDDASHSTPLNASTKNAEAEREIRPLPRSIVGASSKGKERESALLSESIPQSPAIPTKLFSIFTKPNRATNSPSSTQNATVSSPTTNVSVSSTQGEMDTPASSQLLQIDSTEVIHISDDERAIPFPSHGPGSQEDPITIDSSPIKPIKPAVPIHGFFAPRKPVTKAKPDDYAKPSMSSAKSRAIIYPPWPDGTSQHVNGDQTLFAEQRRIFIPSRPRESTTSTDTSCQLHWLKSLGEGEPPFLTETGEVHSLTDPAERNEQLQNFCSSNESCPAIYRFHSADFLKSASNTMQESWTDKWRPRQAQEVLGNEENAEFLRDWLFALEIHVPSSGTMRADQVTAPQTSATTKGRKRKKRESDGDHPKRRIIREVDKKRLRRRRVDSDEESLNDWIVDDDGREDYSEDEPPRSQDDIFSAQCTDMSSDNDDCGVAATALAESPTLNHSHSIDNDDSAAKSAQQRIPIKNDFTKVPLTNCILLLGPPGTGKTAAVYACAEELGWEVFEVYPGIGRRSGGNLDSLVGDVGKNHIVGRASTRSTCASPRKVPAASLDGKSSQHGLFGSNHTIMMEEFVASHGSTGGTVQPTEMLRSVSRAMSPSVPGFGFIAANTPQFASNQHIPTARQSIILLEEVDILYAEDVNFWPTVVKLVRESMRPVVLTCNDTSVIPLDTLPLQAALSFSPCSSLQVSKYLRAMALAEGYSLSNASLAVICDNSYSSLAIDDDVSRSTYRHGTSVPDLRRAIHHLQYFCCGTSRIRNTNPRTESVDVGTSVPRGVEPGLLNPSSRANWDTMRETITPDQLHEFQSVHQLAPLAEAMSIMDSYVQRRPIAALNAYETASGDSIADYEMGHSHLRIGSNTCAREGLPFYNRDDVIALETVRLARKVVRIPVSRNGSAEGDSARSDTGRTEKGPELGHRRATFLAYVSATLTKIVPMVPTVPLSAVVMDYEPWIRWMIRRDDEMEAEAVRAVIQRPGGRMTRNSQRQSYERYISLSEAEREWVKRSGFGE